MTSDATFDELSDLDGELLPERTALSNGWGDILSGGNLVRIPPVKIPVRL